MIAFSSLQARGKAASSFDTLRPDVEFRPRSEDAQRIAIIGGGFYGCHIAANLIRLGFDVTLLEKSDTLLSAASGANQFRLHLGFHYARDHATRIQSRDGFYRFVSEYPDLTGHVPENIYAVASGESLLDHETYRMIMAGSSIPFTEVESASVPVSNVDGMFLTEERVLLTERARSYFRAAVGSHAVLGHRVHSVQDLGGSVLVDGESFDFVIDATYGHFTRPKSPVYYEPTLMLYYETEENHPAVTMVDGPLYSVYPTEDPKVFTLSSVTETPLGRFDDVTEALAVRDSITTDVIEAKAQEDGTAGQPLPARV